MADHVKIYKKEYENLPIRFQNKITHDLDYLIKARIPGLKKVYLFGSCARGEVRSTSDVDLLILTEKRITDRTLSAMIRFGSQTFQREISRDKKLLLEVVE